MSAQYIWDDGVFLTANPLIHAPDGLYKFWFTTQPPDYFPLTSTNLWLEWRLWGDNPMPYHVGNILLQALAAILLWRLLVRLKVPGALLAGLIFALHPMAVSSVAWITERKNTLPMVLMLASMLAYLRFDERGQWKHYVLALGLFLAALLAKTSVVMMPVALLLLAFWLRGRIGLKDVLRSLPFFALSAVLGLVTVWYQQHIAMAEKSLPLGPLTQRLATAGWVAWFYLCKLLLPVRLCMIYPRWQVNAGQWLSFVPTALLLVVLAGLFMLRRRIGRGPVTAMAYFLVMLLPVLGFVSMSFMEFSFVADHLQYTAMIGIVALVAGLAATAAARWKLPRTASVAISAVVLGVLGTATWARASEFKDEPTLWKANLKLNDQAWPAWNSLAVHENDPQLKLEYCSKAIALNPQYADAWCNRAYAQELLGHYPEALADAAKALELGPHLAEGHINRSSVFQRMGRFDLAEQEADAALKVRENYADAYVCRGSARRGQGRIDEAIDDFDTAIRLGGLAPAFDGRGRCYLVKGHTDLALADFDRAIELQPNYAEAYSNRGSVRRAIGQVDAAIADQSRAIQINPRLAGAYNNRAVSYFAAKQYDRAWADVKTCRELGGTPPPAFIDALGQASGRSE